MLNTFMLVVVVFHAFVVKNFQNMFRHQLEYFENFIDIFSFS